MLRYKGWERLAYILFGVFLVGGVIWDVGIAAGTAPVLLYVNEDFVSDLFSGILTFSTLSLTVLSIIISVLDTRSYGIKLRDLVFFRSSPINFNGYILFNMVLTILAVGALACELCTLMSAVTMVCIFYTYFTSILVFKIVADSQLCQQIVLAELGAENKAMANTYLVEWIAEYQNAIVTKSAAEIDMYAGVLKASREYVTLSDYDKYLKELFQAACRSYPVADALQLTFVRTGMSARMLPVCQSCAEETEYADAYDIHKMDIPALVGGVVDFYKILRFDQIDEFRACRVIPYMYFQAVLKGSLPDSEKAEVLKAIIGKSAEIPGDCSGELKGELIERIVLRDIICGDSGLQNVLYEKLINSLRLKNLQRKDDRYFVQTVACILRRLYFYAFLDEQVLDEEARSNIQKMFTQELKKPYLAIGLTPFFDLVFRREAAFMIVYLLDLTNVWEMCALYDAEDEEEGYKALAHLELNSPKNKLKFVLWFYFAADVDAKEIPIEAYRQEIHEKLAANRKAVAALLDEFKPGGTALTESCMDHIQRLRQCMGGWSFYSSQKIQRAYDDIQAFLSQP